MSHHHHDAHCSHHHQHHHTSSAHSTLNYCHDHTPLDDNKEDTHVEQKYDPLHEYKNISEDAGKYTASLDPILKSSLLAFADQVQKAIPKVGTPIVCASAGVVRFVLF